MKVAVFSPNKKKAPTPINASNPTTAIIKGRLIPFFLFCLLFDSGSAVWGSATATSGSTTGSDSAVLGSATSKVPPNTVSLSDWNTVVEETNGSALFKGLAISLLRASYFFTVPILGPSLLGLIFFWLRLSL